VGGGGAVGRGRDRRRRLYNRAGGWTELSRWKAVWPVVEGVMWGGFVVAWMIASRLLPRALAIVLALPGIVSYSAYLCTTPSSC
jgi:hypothetical protein